MGGYCVRCFLLMLEAMEVQPSAKKAKTIPCDAGELRFRICRAAIGRERNVFLIRLRVTRDRCWTPARLTRGKARLTPRPRRVTPFQNVTSFAGLESEWHPLMDLFQGNEDETVPPRFTFHFLAKSGPRDYPAINHRPWRFKKKMV